MDAKHIQELLPIGSIVRLRDASKKLMIFGICQSEQGSEKDYDYIGVLYPEGNMSADMQFMFQHSDIEQVIFTGYVDDEREQFIDNLIRFYNAES